MKIHLERQALVPRLILLMGLLLYGWVWHAHAQDRGSRPIEFSEPRTGADAPTNDQNFGSERRRLTDLEDRLSKTFSFFEFEDSMSGAPAPRAPRRAPVAAKPSKRSGFLVDEKDWAFSDPLSSLKDADQEEAYGDHLLPGENGDSRSAQREANLLNSLRGDDWLVNGAERETFWEMSPASSGRDPNEAGLLNGHNEQADQTFDAASDEDLWPRLERLLGAKDSTISVPETRDSERRSFVDAEPGAWDPFLRQRRETRTEQYRALVGFGVNDPLNGSMVNGAPELSGNDVSRYGPTPLTMEGFGGGRSRQSLQPVMSAGRSSLTPTAPAAPSRTTVFDSLEVEPPLSSAPASTVSKPFYQRPQRQF